MERESRVLLPDVRGDKAERSVPRGKSAVLGHDANAQHVGTGRACAPGSFGDQSFAVTGTTVGGTHGEMSQLPDSRALPGWAGEGTAQNPSSGVYGPEQGETLGNDRSEVSKAPKGRIVRGVGGSDAEGGHYRTESLVLYLQALSMPLGSEIEQLTQRKLSFHALSTSCAHSRPKSQP